MKTTFTYPSEEDAEEAQLRGKRRLGMMKRGELTVLSTVENLRLWLISGGEKGIRQTVDPGQAGYAILINRYLEDRRKQVEMEHSPTNPTRATRHSWSFSRRIASRRTPP